jgi:glycerol kinase
VEEVIKEAVQSARVSGFTPRAAGLSCQRSSCLLWNEKTGEPLSPVISWRDTRGAELIDRIKAEKDALFEASGLPLTPYYSASKLRWLKDNSTAPETETTVFGTLSSFLTQRITSGTRALIDHTHAARTQLMNIRSLEWDRTLLELFGLSDIRLPGIVPVIQDFGNIATAAGPVPLQVCIGDQQAAMIGLGVLERGDGGINYGTGGFLLCNTGTELVPAKGLMSSIHYSSPDARHYLIEGSVNAAGDALEWARSRMGLFTDYEQLDDLCWQAATDVVAFIGLNGTGAPHWEQKISSSVYGMTAESASADIVRAIVEGIAFFVKDIEEKISQAGLDPGKLAVSGGLSSLTYLVQIQSDILDKELRVSAQQDVSALGAALLAGLGTGTWTATDIKKMTAMGETVLPRRNPGVGNRYRRWKELHRITRDLDSL